jgi:hypothetical protein
MCKGYGLWLRYRVRGALGYVVVCGDALVVGGPRYRVRGVIGYAIVYIVISGPWYRVRGRCRVRDVVGYVVVCGDGCMRSPL